MAGQRATRGSARHPSEGLIVLHKYRVAKENIMVAMDPLQHEIIIIVISLKQSLPNAYALSEKTKIQGTIQHGQ